MQAPPSDIEPPKSSAVASWVLYDLANTVFSMGVVSMYLPLWVRQQAGVDKADTAIGIVTALSMGLIFLLSPILGSMSDRARLRLPFLTVSTIGCVALTLCMGRVSYVNTLLAFALANACYQGGLQFYDSLLPSVSTPQNRGKIGGVGVAVGYVGSFLAIGLKLASPHFGWTIPTLFTLSAILFFAFALPCFLLVSERKNPRSRPVFSMYETRAALLQTYATLRESKDHPELRIFLIGRLFYTDPINTVIAFMLLYASNVAQSAGVTGAKAEQIATLVMAGAVVFAILGGFGAGVLVDKLGARRVLRIVLYCWCATFCLAACLGIFGLPWRLLMLVSSMAGLSLGATWAADRPLMLELTPPERLGEFYGLYGMVGRFAAIIGPVIWAVTTGIMQRIGWTTLGAEGVSIVVLLLFMLVAMRILWPVISKPSSRNLAEN